MLVEANRANAGTDQPIELGAGHVVVTAVHDPVVPGVGPAGLHGRSLEAKGILERAGQLIGHGDQVDAKGDRLTGARNLDLAIGFPHADVPVRLGEPGEPALMVAQPDERLESAVQPRGRKHAGVARAPPASGPGVQENGVRGGEGNFQSQPVDPCFALKRDQPKIAADHAVVFDDCLRLALEIGRPARAHQPDPVRPSFCLTRDDIDPRQRLARYLARKVNRTGQKLNTALEATRATQVAPNRNVRPHISTRSPVATMGVQGGNTSLVTPAPVPSHGA